MSDSRHIWMMSVLVIIVGGMARAGTQTEIAPSNSTFVNPGVYSKVVVGQLYEWIPTEEVTFDIRSNGKVKIHAPKTKRSFNGQTDCRPFLYDHLHRRLDPKESAALFGDGLLLPPGSYGFVIQWLNAADYDDVEARPWDLTSNPDTYQGNSAQLDYFYLSIVPLRPPPPVAGPVREVALPWDLQRASWLPHYQLLPHDLQLPPDKGFGITRLLWDIPMDDVLKKVTHIQYVYSELDARPMNRKWANKQAMNHQGELASNEWLIENHPMDRDYITASEMDENFGRRGFKDHAERPQQVFEGIYRRMEKELGVTSPEQTRLYDDYFSEMEGYGNGVSFLWGFDPKAIKEGLSNQEMARRRWFDNKWTDESRYFSAGAYKYRNWIVSGGYLDSFAVTHEGIHLYNDIYNLERKFAAMPNRRTLKFGWSNAEGVNSTMYRHGVKSRLHFENGDIIRSDVVAWPFHMMLPQSFWSLLLGNDYILWHSSVRLVQNPLAFGDSWAAGAGTTRWQPTGGKTVDYNADDPKQPKRVKDERGQFPNNPHPGESGAFGGAWLVGQITAVSDRTSKTIAYCPFEYRVNKGPVQPGYASGIEPEKGELGDAQLSRYGVANYGQANIVDSYVARKPICIYTEGKAGAAVIFHNIYAGLTDRTEVTVITKRGKRSFTVQGNDLHVFTLN